MILKQDNVNGKTGTLFIPFNELGTTTTDLNKKFTATMKKGKKRTIELSRADFFEAGAAMATVFLTDEAMAWAAKRVAEELDDYPQKRIADDEAFDNAFWKEYERFLTVAYEVPYYEDATLNDFKVGDRVFVKGIAGGTYGNVAELPEPPKDNEVVDDGDFTEMKVKTDDGQIITADIWETVKEY